MRRIILVFLVLLSGLLVHLLTRPPKLDGPDILIVSIDGISNSCLLPDGKMSSSSLRDLAQRGAFFRNCTVESPRTLSTHATLWSGLSSHIHGVSGPENRMSSRIPLLAEQFLLRGYRTAAFLTSPWLDSTFGLDRGFEVYQNSYPLPNRRRQEPANTSPEEGQDRRGAEKTVESVIEWLGKLSAHERFFLGVHLCPGRNKPSENPDPAFWVSRLDQLLGAIIEALHANHRFLNTRIVVIGTSGRGLSPQNPAQVLERSCVPLLLAGFELAPNSVRDDAIGTLDLAPTLLSQFGFPHVLPGRNLLKKAKASSGVLGNISKGGTVLRLGRRGLLESLDNSPPQIYVLDLDRGLFHVPAEGESPSAEELLRIGNQRRQELAIFREEHYPGLDSTHPELGDRLRTLRSIGYLR
ncbi:MAG: sulfatase-like hydrolase/transferase [Planctomycetota bacterium]|nr:sulfatase-like hydrolase/transferase [Planctomycetota bacterium]